VVGTSMLVANRDVFDKDTVPESVSDPVHMERAEDVAASLNQHSLGDFQ
jgi:hypothetical protein